MSALFSRTGYSVVSFGVKNCFVSLSSLELISFNDCHIESLIDSSIGFLLPLDRESERHTVVQTQQMKRMGSEMRRGNN